DWLTAIVALRPGASEQAAISQLLGCSIRAREMEIGPRVSKRPQRPERTDEGVSPVPEQPRSADLPASPKRRLESTLVPLNVSPNTAPDWLERVAPLQSTDARHLSSTIPMEPLFPARTTRAILSGALSTPFRSGQLDIQRVVDHVSRAETIAELP